MKLDNGLEKIDETVTQNYSSNKLVDKLSKTKFDETMENVLGFANSGSKKKSESRPKTQMDII
jgi:hypothetical protein